MHIPSCASEELEILSFRESLYRSEKSEDYDREHWLYAPDHYCEYRYILGTKGKKPLICIGINPSTAKPGDLDNTLKSVARIADGNGFDSFIMFNVYPQRATRPKDMDLQCNALLHRENMEAFSYILSLSEEPPVIWAAWGTIIEEREYLSDCLMDLIRRGEAFHARWVTAGQRSKKAGHPHHPLYLKKDSALDDFDAAAYCADLRRTK